MNDRTQQVAEALNLLRSRLATSEQIVRAIVTIGKPLDVSVAEEAAPLVATYLDNPSSLVRYEAIWFLGSWVRLPDFTGQVLEAAKNDPEMDNRAFAMRSLGLLLRKKPNQQASTYLFDVAQDKHLERDLRLAAYSALRNAFSMTDSRDFEPIGEKSISDMDVLWLERTRSSAHV